MNRAQAQAQLAHQYAQGLADGTIGTLLVLLGRPEFETTLPAPQEHVTPEVRRWAEEALARAQEHAPRD